MVDFKTPDLPGASDVYNKIAGKVDDVEKSVMGKLDSTASALKASLEPDLLDLKAKVQGMIPELPTAPSLNLQSEITALSNLTVGSDAYTAKLATIGTSFGSAITAGGYNLDSIASAGASALAGATGSLTAAIPNMELPTGATDAIEIAKAALQPDIDAVAEAASEFSTDKSEDLVKGIFGDALARESLETDMAAVESKMKSFAEAFETKAKRLTQQLKEVNATAREEEIIEI